MHWEKANGPDLVGPVGEEAAEVPVASTLATPGAAAPLEHAAPSKASPNIAMATEQARQSQGLPRRPWLLLQAAAASRTQ